MRILIALALLAVLSCSSELPSTPDLPVAPTPPAPSPQAVPSPNSQAPVSNFTLTADRFGTARVVSHVDWPAYLRIEWRYIQPDGTKELRQSKDFTLPAGTEAAFELHPCERYGHWEISVPGHGLRVEVTINLLSMASAFDCGH